MHKMLSIDSAFSRAVLRTVPLARSGGGTVPGRRAAGIPVVPLDNMDVEYDEETRSCWCYMAPKDRASFTPGLLADMSSVQDMFGQMFLNAQDSAPLKYVVVGSRIPGIFNLGGDLALFSDLIRMRDEEGLLRYALSCIDVIYRNAVSYDLPLVTLALVQGDALGGGFEAALSCDVIVAERQAKFGLPEILFNLFPGMGAYSFLSRRLGAKAAEKIIMSGRIYTAEEFHDMGVVDVLCEEGEGPASVRGYVTRHGRRHMAEQAVYKVGRRVQPITYDELRDVTEIWVATALRLTEADLRKMSRITAAQGRRWVGRRDDAIPA